MTNTDMELLREYASRQSEQAFETLVSRHLSLVHSAAVRQVQDSLLAEEITQTVFIILARKAGSLSPKTILPGWLYRTTRYVAAAALKIQRRREHREKEACISSMFQDSQTDSVWEHLSPLLDGAMAQLRDRDRDALVLRYFQNKSLREVGVELGLDEYAAQKRVARALEKLRAILGKRGLAMTTTVMIGAISLNSAQAAPLALGKSVAAVALTKGAAASGSTLPILKGALKIMVWTKAKIAAVTAIALIATTGTITVAVKTEAFGVENRNSPEIMNDGINRAQSIPNALYTYTAGDEKTRLYIEAVIKRFHKGVDPAAVIKSDQELTEAEIQTSTIYIYGSPENNSFFQRVRDQLPIVFKEDGIVVGNKKCVGKDVGAIFTCPNPLSPVNQLIIYGTVSAAALDNMNGIYHGPTDYVVFNNVTRQARSCKNGADCYLLLGAFDKSDPAQWKVSEKLQLRPLAPLKKATDRFVVKR